jgi:quercetin dioxygenase-like cupin family protein
VEIRRFGPGHRRPDGPPGTQGLTGQVLWADERANVSELAFSRHGLVAMHDNPNTVLFIVVSGGGWTQVGDERVRINHGEAVVWPPDLPHGAWTDGSEMRAIVVELTQRSEAASAIEAGVLEGRAAPVEDAAPAEPTAPGPQPARGQLADRPIPRHEHDEAEGEPW